MASRAKSTTDDTEESLSPTFAASGVPRPRSRQYPAVRYVNDDADDLDLGLSYRYERDTLRRSEIKRSVVIDLPKFRHHEDSDAEHPPIEPAIIWKAKVYQSQGNTRGEDLQLHRSDLTYVDDRPIEFSVSLSPTKPPLETDEDVPEPAAWTGPVIIIETFVEADIGRERLSEMKRLSEIVASPCLDMFNPKHVSRRHIVVESPFLAEGLRNLVQYYPSFHQMLLDDSKGGELRIEEPFSVLFHHFDAIAAMADETTGATVCNAENDSKDQGTDLKAVHTQHLMDFLRPIYTESILACEKHLSNSVPQVAFDMIWYPLKPGTDVYVQLDGSTQAAVVMGVRRTYVSLSKVWGAGSDGSWLVDLRRLETDGSRLRRGFISARINPYSGLRDLISLPVCPVSIWDAYDGGERREKFLRRAATFFKALQRGNLLVDYKGPIKETAQYVRHGLTEKR
jgi:hypothetical protein